jgi:hypothetical protein
MKTNTQNLAAALRILANDIESPDGVVNAAILEAAERLDELMAQVAGMKDEISDFCAALDGMLMAGLEPDEIAEDLEKRLSHHDSPTQCLREIQAEAGRAGFIAGADSYFDRHYDKSVSDEVLLSAEKYAEHIRQGAKP